MKKTDSVVDLSKINLVLSPRMMHQQPIWVSVFFHTRIACKERIQVLKGTSLRVCESESGKLIQSDKLVPHLLALHFVL